MSASCDTISLQNPTISKINVNKPDEFFVFQSIFSIDIQTVVDVCTVHNPIRPQNPHLYIVSTNLTLCEMSQPNLWRGLSLAPHMRVKANPKLGPRPNTQQA
jgi:hypothetical protein